MWAKMVLTDFNGLVLFAPDLLADHFGGAIPEGTDLFTRFMQTDDGDAVLAAGLIVPVLAIDDAPYTVIVRMATEQSPIAAETVVVENGTVALAVATRVVVADLVVLKEWIDDLGWHDVDTGLEHGAYAVTVRGFRVLDAAQHTIVDAGYEFVLDPRPALPTVTADTGTKMRVMW